MVGAVHSIPARSREIWRSTNRKMQRNRGHPPPEPEEPRAAAAGLLAGQRTAVVGNLLLRTVVRRGWARHLPKQGIVRLAAHCRSLS